MARVGWVVGFAGVSIKVDITHSLSLGSLVVNLEDHPDLGSARTFGESCDSEAHYP